MFRFASRACAAIGLLAMTACGPSTPPVDPKKIAADVSALADTYVRSYLDAFPYQAIVIGANDAHPSLLGDHSLPALKKWQAREDELLASLKKIDVKAIDDMPEATTYEFLQNQLESSIGYRVCRMELWNVSPTYTGWQGDLPIAAGMQNVSRPQDQQDAIARWSQVAQYLDDEIANLKEGLKLGYSAPKSNVQSVLNQMNAMLAAPIDESPFVQMAKPGAPASFKKALQAQEQKLIRPAITRYRDFLVQTYLAAAREAIGVSANPDGAACYVAAVKYHATVKMTAQEIHDLGKAQIEKITAEMKTIGKRSFNTEDPAALLKLVTTDPKYRFKNR